MKMLTTVPYYRIPRDEDGRANRHFDHDYEMAMRWQPEVEIPDGMVTPTSVKRGEAPVHSGFSALKILRDGGEVSQRQLDAAYTYLAAAIAYYRTGPDEPYPGRNAEAARDLTNLYTLLGVETDDEFEFVRSSEGGPRWVWVATCDVLDSAMKAVWKFTFPLDCSALIVHLAEQRVVLVAHDPANPEPTPSIWIEHSGELLAGATPCTYAMIGTGMRIPEGDHVGSCICEGPLVWHVYEVPSGDNDPRWS